jgi:hypothetical protein
MAQSTLAESAFGTLLYMCSDANGTSPTEIAELRDLNYNVTAKREETTTHNQDDPWETGIVTSLKMGPVEFMVNWKNSTASHGDESGVLAVMIAREERTWQLHESDETTIVEFNAHVVSKKASRAVSGVRTGAFTLDGTGKPDFSKAA